MNQKIGVYICQCGSNIADYVDVDHVKSEISKIEGVALSKVTMFACADSTQQEIRNDIKEHGLNRLVIASCSPTLHKHTFRNVALKSGLNPHHYVQVNIREQGSWAHSDDKAGATKKAVRMIRAGIARASNSHALTPIKIPALNTVAIIGAGIAGLRSAIELADVGVQVFLIEKDFFVGGRVAQWGETCSMKTDGKVLVQRLCSEIEKRDNIELYLGSQVKKMSGNVGNYQLEIEMTPRCIRSDAPRARLMELMAKLDATVADEYNFNIVKRKPVYFKYDGAFPDLPVADMAAMDGLQSLLEEYPDCIDREQRVESKAVHVGALIVSTGFDPYEPSEGEYGYRENDFIVTLQELERIVELNQGSALQYKGRTIKTIVYIYCVGSCTGSGDTNYCSRICCTRTISLATHLKEKYRGIQNYHLYRHMRSYGKQEILFDNALKAGDLFLKFGDDDPPEVLVEGEKTTVIINDLLTDNERIEFHPDLTVLVTGMAARKDSGSLSRILKIPVGRDKFFNEVHPKLRPVETVIDGVFISGTCQGPKSISESIKSALSSASKAYSLINKGEIELEPTMATIKTELCDGCSLCIGACPFSAIVWQEGGDRKVAGVNTSICKGCGICTPVCPQKAIEIKGYTNNEVLGMIDDLVAAE